MKNIRTSLFDGRLLSFVRMFFADFFSVSVCPWSSSSSSTHLLSTYFLTAFYSLPNLLGKIINIWLVWSFWWNCCYNIILYVVKQLLKASNNLFPFSYVYPFQILCREEILSFTTTTPPLQQTIIFTYLSLTLTYLLPSLLLIIIEKFIRCRVDFGKCVFSSYQSAQTSFAFDWRIFYSFPSKLFANYEQLWDFSKIFKFFRNICRVFLPFLIRFFQTPLSGRVVGR